MLTMLSSPRYNFAPSLVEFCSDVLVTPGVHGRVVAGAGHGHQVAQEEHQVVEPPTFFKKNIFNEKEGFLSGFILLILTICDFKQIY